MSASFERSCVVYREAVKVYSSIYIYKAGAVASRPLSLNNGATQVEAAVAFESAQEAKKDILEYIVCVCVCVYISKEAASAAAADGEPVCLVLPFPTSGRDETVQRYVL